MRLQVIGKYQNSALGMDVRAGDVIEANNADAEFLLRDAPGCFEEYKAKAAQAPANEMIDLSDGVNDSEAALAGKALRRRRDRRGVTK